MRKQSLTAMSKRASLPLSFKNRRILDSLQDLRRALELFESNRNDPFFAKILVTFLNYLLEQLKRRDDQMIQELGNFVESRKYLLELWGNIKHGSRDSGQFQEYLEFVQNPERQDRMLHISDDIKQLLDFAECRTDEIFKDGIEEVVSVGLQITVLDKMEEDIHDQKN